MPTSILQTSFCGPVTPISASVGKDGVNNLEDVKTVQTLLRMHSWVEVHVTGQCDAKTIHAIKEFQQRLKHEHPAVHTADSKVDPGGNTWRWLTLGKSTGFIQLPHAGPGFYIYPPQSYERQFGTAATVQALVQVAATFAFNMPKLRLGYGNMSFKDGSPMSPHTTHKNGRCADVRPVRKDNSPVGTYLSDSKYSRQRTILLVESFLAHQNVSHILFNDPFIIQKFPGRVTQCHGHDNHLHVEFRA